MRRSRTKLPSLDITTLAGGFALATSAFVVISPETPIVGRALCFASAIAVAFALGTRHGLALSTRDFERVSRRLKRVTEETSVVEQDADGKVRAFMTRDGEPLVLDVPDEIAAGGPFFVAFWLAEQTADDDD